jgi:hypothetical protein
MRYNEGGGSATSKSRGRLHLKGLNAGPKQGAFQRLEIASMKI